MNLELRIEQALAQTGGSEMGACVWHPAGSRGGGFWACPCGWTSKVVRRGLGIAEEEAAVRHATRCDENWPARKPGGKRRHGISGDPWKLNPGWKWQSKDSAYYAGPVKSAIVTMIDADTFLLTVWRDGVKLEEHDYHYPISAMNAAEEMGVKGRAGGKSRHGCGKGRR
jgi:hypothetical protein